MGITSLSYIGFFLGVIILYFVMPKKAKWPYLLVTSLTYFLLAGEPILVIYPIASIAIAWICTNKMCNEGANKKALLWMAIATNLGVLLVLKYLNLGIYTYNAFGERFSEAFVPSQGLRFWVPIGVSFYTMSVLSYIFDVYYGMCEPEKNYFKLLLFGTYFPLMISGPIVRYKDMKDGLFKPHKFDYKSFTYGAQRIVWGFFKALVISERLAKIVNPVFEDYRQYRGTYIVVAAWCFVLQLYSNFSGSMDIIIGISEMMGIELPENFRQPFFSKTIQEFWQRWHITLGAWTKDYILYPVLRTKAFMALPGKWKDKLGKKRAKQYTTFIAMMIVWLAVGLWHGGSWKYIFGTGVLQGIYIIVSELIAPAFKKKSNKVLDILRMIRTFFLISIGLLFFNASSLTDGFAMIKAAFKAWNPNILWDGSLLELGLSIKDWAILIFALLVMWAVSFLQTKGSVRDMLAKKNIVIRWIVLYALLFFVIIFGQYGPGFDAAEFIYQGF